MGSIMLWEHVFVHSGAGSMYVKMPSGLACVGVSRLSETAGTVYLCENEDITPTLPNDAKVMVNNTICNQFFPQRIFKTGVVGSTVAGAATVKVVLWVSKNKQYQI